MEKLKNRMTKPQPWKIYKLRGEKKFRLPPFAPSINENKLYLSIIKKVKDDKKLPQRILILGATPELRDTAIQNGLESYAVDISKQMMKKFSNLMKHKGHNLDKQLIGNWLNMSFPQNFFGAAMGDASLVNLATKQENEKLIKILFGMISRNGYLVLRQMVYPAKYQPINSLNKLVGLFRKRKISWEDFFMELRMYVFKPKAYNQKTFQFNTKKTFQLIKDSFIKGLLTIGEYNKIYHFRNDVVSTYYPEKIFIKMVEAKGFKLIKTFKDKPHRFYSYLHVFVFKKI